MAWWGIEHTTWARAQAAVTTGLGWVLLLGTETRLGVGAVVRRRAEAAATDAQSALDKWSDENRKQR